MAFKAAVATFAKETLCRMKDSVPTIVTYAKGELLPPKPTELKEIGRGLSNLVSGYKSKNWKNVTVKEAFVNTLVVTEIMMWFFVGEVIGRGQLVGYPLKL